MKSATVALAGQTVYLAGPMRGYPRYNFDAFHEAAAHLRALGVLVVSPAEMDEDLGFDPDRDVADEAFVEDALRRDFEAIAQVDAVVFMDGSRFSSGALAEDEVALALGLPRYRLGRDPWRLVPLVGPLQGAGPIPYAWAV